MATGPLTIDAAVRSAGLRRIQAVPDAFSSRVPPWQRLVRTMLGVTAAFTCGLVLSELSVLEDRRQPPGAPGSMAHTVSSGVSVGASQCSERVYDRLFFGLRTPAGTVSDAEWTGFLHEVVTPRFPDGLTVVDAHGQWRGAGERNVTVERSRVVEIAHDDSPVVDRDIDEVVAVYKHRYRQRSVMRTRARVEVCL